MSLLVEVFKNMLTPKSIPGRKKLGKCSHYLLGSMHSMCKGHEVGST